MVLKDFLCEKGKNQQQKHLFAANFQRLTLAPLSDYLDCISQYFNHIAVAQLGSLARFRLAVQHNNSVFDKLVGLCPILAYPQKFYEFVQLNIRLPAIGHWFECKFAHNQSQIRYKIGNIDTFFCRYIIGGRNTYRQQNQWFAVVVKTKFR